MNIYIIMEDTGDISKLNRTEKIALKKKLNEEGKNICFGPLCRGKIKLLDEFVKSKNGYKNICHICNRHNWRKSYDKNEKASRREKNRLKIGKCCVKCGCNDPELLEFDHIEMGTKEFEISDCQSAKKIIKEAEKTQLLCIWCHRLKSQQYVKDNLIKELEDYEYTEEKNNEIINPIKSKSCSGPLCQGKIRNLDNFYYSEKNKKWTSHCKNCYGYSKKLIRIENSNFVDNFKMQIGECQDCHKQVTKDTIFCFDFDHLEQNEKMVNISSLRCSTKKKN